jgi:hypothetical protein
VNSFVRSASRAFKLFLTLLVIAVLVQLLGQAGTVLVELRWPGAGTAAVDALARELAAAAMCVLVVFLLGHVYPRPSWPIASAKAFVTVAGIVATNTLLNTLQALAVAFLGEADSWRGTVGWSLLFMVCGLAWGQVAMKLLPGIQRWYQLPVDRGESEAVYGDGPVVIVMLVSPIEAGSLALEPSGGGAIVKMTGRRTGAPVERRLACQNVAIDAAALDNDERAHWSWQQLLRGVSGAIGRDGPRDMTTIILVGSSGPHGSFKLLNFCIEYLRRYPQMMDAQRVTIMTSPDFLKDSKARMNSRPKGGASPVWARIGAVNRLVGERISGVRASLAALARGEHAASAIDVSTDRIDELGENGIDFESFNDVRNHVFQVVQEASRRVGDDRVFVDVTGGQKTASIAAAVATTGETGRCQYVQTNRPNDVLFYDLHPLEQFSW